MIEILKQCQPIFFWINICLCLFVLIMIGLLLKSLLQFAKTTIITMSPLQDTQKRVEYMTIQVEMITNYFKPLINVVQQILKIRILKKIINRKS